MSESTINIRLIQHYMYCPRRYALLEINNDWAENVFVIKANIMHENVHSGNHTFSDRNKVVKSSVSIYNDEPKYDLYGVADCMEFEKSESGVEIQGYDGLFKINVVEYKPRPPKSSSFHETDAIQVFAQKLCVDYIWKSDCECYIYYSETKKRIKLPFDIEFEKYNNMLLMYLKEIRNINKNKTIPKRKRGQKCSGCSLYDVCFPKEKIYNVKDTIMSMEKGDFE